MAIRKALEAASKNLSWSRSHLQDRARRFDSGLVDWQSWQAGGAGINLLRGQNNVQGSAQMGCKPTSLIRAQPLEEARALFEQICGCDIPTRRGLTLLDIVDGAAAGKLKAMWAIGYDFYLTLAHLNRRGDFPS